MMTLRDRHRPLGRRARSRGGSIMNRDEVLDILRKAYQIEVDGYTFYSMTADRADKPAVQELFGKLATDEVQHQAFLRSVLKGYDDHGLSAFSMSMKIPDLGAFSNKV